MIAGCSQPDVTRLRRVTILRASFREKPGERLALTFPIVPHAKDATPV
jgi:hypothetical protein